jgi:hypothetical protein
MGVHVRLRLLADRLRGPFHGGGAAVRRRSRYRRGNPGQGDAADEAADAECGDSRGVTGCHERGPPVCVLLELSSGLSLTRG